LIFVTLATYFTQNGRKRIARLALRYGANINHQVLRRVVSLLFLTVLFHDLIMHSTTIILTFSAEQAGADLPALCFRVRIQIPPIPPIHSS
jgi:hypothetical protein